MTRLQTMVYETSQLPIPDPRQITEEEKEQIVDAFDNLLAKEKSLDNPEPGDKEAARDELDRVILRVLGLEDRQDELKQAVNNLVKSREMASGQHTSVLVDRLQRAGDAGEAIDLPGVDSVRESTTLSDF